MVNGNSKLTSVVRLKKILLLLLRNLISTSRIMAADSKALPLETKTLHVPPLEEVVGSKCFLSLII